MPKKTFHNLTSDKQDKILDAAKVEFSKHPYNEVSINIIIKNAGIPRGSFYQYFTDKDDLYTYLFDELITHTISSITTNLKAAEGNIFLAYRQLIIDELKLLDDTYYVSFFRNHILSSGSNMSQRIKNIRSNDQALFDATDKSLINIDNVEDFQLLIMLLYSTTERILIHAFIYEWSQEKALERFDKALLMIKTGASANER